MVKKVLFMAVLCATLFLAASCSSQEKPVAIEPFAIVVLPDTQFYSEKYPEIFTSQTTWIKENKENENIVFVLHVGDITEHNSKSEWQRANESMTILDGVVPYTLCVGNHDYSCNVRDGKVQYKRGECSSLFDDYFPYTRYESQQWYGGHMGQSNLSHYCLFEVGDLKFMILSLEFYYGDEEIKWANEKIASYPDRRVIILTHGYMNADGDRLSTGKAEGKDIWERLVRKHENIFLLLCGHIDGGAVLTCGGNEGNTIHHVLSNFQHWGQQHSGDGSLRIMKFVPSENKIKVKTYSPYTDEYRTDTLHSFELDYEMN